MGRRPVMTATERFKMLLANALERVCVLEEQVEAALERVRALEAAQNGNQEAEHHERARD